MDIFRVLSRGASLNKSKDYKSDFTAPDKEKSAKDVKSNKDLSDQVEKELDFFHTKQHKAIKNANKSNAESSSESDGENDQEDGPGENKPKTKLVARITTKEEAMDLRQKYGSKVTGSDIPLPIGSFEDLISRFKLSKKLLENLVANNFTDPTPIQSEAIPCSLFGRDLIACAPTGSGKTLAFLIPLVQNILNMNKKVDDKDKVLRGLVVSPTKELAQQINQQLNKITQGLNINTGYLNKSLASKYRDHAVKASKFDIIVTTPLRLIELVKNDLLDLSTVKHLVFDEADSLFQSDFLEQTDSILSSLTNPELVRCIFSATITSHVEQIANTIMTDPIRVIIGLKEAANANIEQKIVYCGDEHGKLVEIRNIIRSGEFKPPVIIFLQSIDRAKALFNELLYDGLNVDAIHAERTQKQREEAISRFKSGELWCLITTDIIARGIDFKGINLVINYDVPNSTQAYVHRIGRTGRAGRTGKAITFYTKEDTHMIKNVVNVMRASGQLEGMPQWMRDGNALTKLSKDRRKQLKRQQVERSKISTVPRVFKKRKFRKS